MKMYQVENIIIEQSKNRNHDKKKILVFFICSIVPYISKGQCLDSLKSVCLPDSIAEQIENSYEDKYTNASKNVVNLISPNNYNFVDGIYAFKGMGPHFPRQIFVYKRERKFSSLIAEGTIIQKVLLWNSALVLKS